ILSLLERVRDGETITIDGNDGIRINPIHVDNAVSVFPPALELDRSEIFNVAGDEAVTLRELVTLIGEIASQKVSIETKNSHANGDLVGDNARLKEQLG